MKPLVYTCVVIITIIFVGFATIKMLENDSKVLNDLIIEIEDHVLMDRWEEAGTKEKQLKAQWKEYEKKWPMLIDHTEIDNINLHLSELEVFVANKDKTLSAAKLSVLKLLVNHIPQKEYVILQNIF